MKRFLVLLCLLTALVSFAAQTVKMSMDSKWKAMPRTRDAIVRVTKGGLELINRNADRSYAGVSRKLTVDLTANPWLVVEVKDVTTNGHLKVLCGKKKLQILDFSKPGTYQINIAEALKVKGKQKLEVCLYVLGTDAAVIYSGVRFSSAKEKVVSTEPAFYVKPTFINAGYYFKSKNIGAVTPYFKVKGTADWNPGIAACYDAVNAQYRGSIVRLKENTVYDIKLVDSKNKTVASGTFRTWADKVKIAKTVVIDPAKLKKTLVIRDRGSENGWICYTQKPGTVIDFKKVATVIRLEQARYVILDKLNIKGGGKHAIEVNSCRNVRICNSDISGWGIVGEQRCDYNGRFHEKGKKPSGYGINMNGAINIIKGHGIVVERCYIHDPRNRANSWFYSHPAGPQAVTVGSPESCVIRYNDFVGSDEHRFNDAVESLGNFSRDGGLNRDADVYGNFMIYCSDDNIELDGGQQNIRCFDNRFEGSFCGVSIQGCMTGPSYVYDNTFLNMGDEFGAVGQTLKSCAGPHWGALSRNNHSYIFNNTFTGPGEGTNIDVFMDYRNNIWGDTRKIGGADKPHTGSGNIFEKRSASKGYTMTNTMRGKVKFADKKGGNLALAENSKFKGKATPIANFTAGSKVDPGALHAVKVQPNRPLPVCVKPQQLNYTCVLDNISAPQTVKVKAVCPKFNGKFKVVKNRDFDWFEVTPSAGVLKGGKELALTVKIKDGFVPKYRKYRGAFLVRFEDGLSRPVSLYLDTDFKAVACPEKDGVKNIYVDFTTPTSGKQYAVIDHVDGAKGKALDFRTKSYSCRSKTFDGTDADIAEYEFEIPEDGQYFLMVRGCVAKDAPAITNSCFMSLDGAPLTEQYLTLTFSERMSWVFLKTPQSPTKVHECKVLNLKKGRHTLRVAPRKPIYLDSFCITTDPRIFEDR
ncbi:MAG: hypothetical protein IJW08_04390 [Lentisphaeria bacterium]|nr:hypothetical protein [Lentisphaeria bacterium]